MVNRSLIRAIKQLVLLVALSFVVRAVPAYAYDSTSGWCQQGNQTVATGGLVSTTKVQRSYPSCTVTVYLTGTVTLATIYSDNTNPPTPIPGGSFTASTNGRWQFWAAAGHYDIVMSAGGMTAPLTLRDQVIGNTTVICDYSASSDLGLIMAAAIANLPSIGGVVDCRNLPSNLIAASTITINKKIHWILPFGNMILHGSPGINVTSGGTCIDGQGEQASTFNFDPVGTATAIEWGSGIGDVIGYGCMMGFTLDAALDTTNIKTGINIVDQEELYVAHISISNWTGTAKNSTGLRVQGRQALTGTNWTFNADQPFRISIDPNTSIVAADHYHLANLYLIADLTQPAVKVDDGVFLTDVTFDGYEAFAAGFAGFYWNDTTGTHDSYSITLQNIRCEQGAGPAATHYCVYFSPNHQTFDSDITRMTTDHNFNGIYVRNLLSGLISHNFYNGLDTAININSGTHVEVSNNFWNASNSTVTRSGFTGVWCNNDHNGVGFTDGNCEYNTVTARTQFLGDGTTAAPSFARTSIPDMGINFDNNGPTVVVAHTLTTEFNSTGVIPGADNSYALGTLGDRWSGIYSRLGAFTGRITAALGTTIISGSCPSGDCTLTDGNFFVVSGTTAVDGFATSGWTAGSVIVIQTDGNITFNNAGTVAAGFAAMHLVGAANVSMTANDNIMLMYTGAFWDQIAPVLVK